MTDPIDLRAMIKCTNCYKTDQNEPEWLCGVCKIRLLCFLCGERRNNRSVLCDACYELPCLHCAEPRSYDRSNLSVLCVHLLGHTRNVQNLFYALSIQTFLVQLKDAIMIDITYKLHVLYYAKITQISYVIGISVTEW